MKTKSYNSMNFFFDKTPPSRLNERMRFSVPIVVAVLACSIQSFAADLRKELRKDLAVNGYTLYTPFRTDAEPGTIFVFTKDKDHVGKEFVLSQWEETFAIMQDEAFLKTNNVAFENLTNYFSLGADLSVNILKPVMSIGADFAKTNGLQIKFGQLLESHYVSISDLFKKRDQLTQPVRGALSFFAKQKQLDSCYIILETVTAPSVNLKVTAETGAGGTFSADKLTTYLGLKAGVHYKKISEAELVIETPIIIGYKAWRISDSFVDWKVGAFVTSNEKALSPSEIEALKE